MNDDQALEPSQVVMPVTTHELVNRIERIREVQAKVMKEGVDYGLIPGCGDKPTLLKPGAETLLLAFQMAAVPDQLTIQDLGSEDEIRYRVVTPIIHMPTGRLCGNGVGECSSQEEKYKWRRSVCQEEYDEADPDRRRMKWAKSREGAYQVSQIRTQKADVANTVLKIAKKRSLVDGALTVTAASRIFSQDLEDLPEELKPQAPKPSAPPSTEPLAPNYGKYAKQPLSQIPGEELVKYMTGLERAIADPKKEKFKALNMRMHEAMRVELDKRASGEPEEQPGPSPEESRQVPPLPADNLCRQLRLCESEQEIEQLMNPVDLKQYTAAEALEITNVFIATRIRLGIKG